LGFFVYDKFFTQDEEEKGLKELRERYKDCDHNRIKCINCATELHDDNKKDMAKVLKSIFRLGKEAQDLTYKKNILKGELSQRYWLDMDKYKWKTRIMTNEDLEQEIAELNKTLQ